MHGASPKSGPFHGIGNSAELHQWRRHGDKMLESWEETEKRYARDARCFWVGFTLAVTPFAVLIGYAFVTGRT